MELLQTHLIIFSTWIDYSSSFVYLMQGFLKFHPLFQYLQALPNNVFS
jgi:hypothetical protein